jgi:hypothetical protein
MKTNNGVFVVFKTKHSAAASGWAGWALAHPEFGSSVNPITTRGADYAHHITASPPGFGNPAAALKHELKCQFSGNTSVLLGFFDKLFDVIFDDPFMTL